MNNLEPEALDRTSSIVEPETGGHPLFPRPETETGPDTRKFDIIIIHRWLPDGTKEICPKPWKGSELQTWQQVIDQYGGECYYQLAAQCGKTHRYQGRSEKLYFSGPARKPFHEEVKRAASHEAPAAPPPAPPGHSYYYPPPAAPAQSSSNPELYAMMRAMFETSANAQVMLLKTIAEQRQPQSSPEMAMLLKAVLEQRQSSPEMAMLLKTVLEQRQSPKPNGPEFERGMERGLEFAKKLQGGSSSSDDGGGEFGDLAQIVQMVTSVKAMAGRSEAGRSEPSPQYRQPSPPPQPVAPHGYEMQGWPPGAHGYPPGAMPWQAPMAEWVFIPGAGWLLRPIAEAPAAPPPPPQAHAHAWGARQPARPVARPVVPSAAPPGYVHASAAVSQPVQVPVAAPAPPMPAPAAQVQVPVAAPVPPMHAPTAAAAPIAPPAPSAPDPAAPNEDTAPTTSAPATPAGLAVPPESALIPLPPEFFAPAQEGLAPPWGPIAAPANTPPFQAPPFPDMGPPVSSFIGAPPWAAPPMKEGLYARGEWDDFLDTPDLSGMSERDAINMGPNALMSNPEFRKVANAVITGQMSLDEALPLMISFASGSISN